MQSLYRSLGAEDSVCRRSRSCCKAISFAAQTFVTCCDFYSPSAVMSSASVQPSHLAQAAGDELLNGCRHMVAGACWADTKLVLLMVLQKLSDKLPLQQPRHLSGSRSWHLAQQLLPMHAVSLCLDLLVYHGLRISRQMA